MRAQHINITIPVALKTELDVRSKQEKIKRSTYIQKALKVYMDLSKRKKVNDLLTQGYAEMSDEAVELSKEFGKLDIEGLRNVD